MKTKPRLAYMYQPMPPQADGRFYGVGGLHLFGPDLSLIGVTKGDAQMIANACNDDPKKAAEFIGDIKEMMNNDWKPECGCRLESLFSCAVLLCEKCSKLPCHSGAS